MQRSVNGFLLRVLEAGPLGSSTFGVGGTGGAGGATLGGFVWGFNLGGVSRKFRLGSPWSVLSSGGSMCVRFCQKFAVLCVFDC